MVQYDVRIPVTMCMAHQKEFDASCVGMKITKNLCLTEKYLIANHMDLSAKYLYYSHDIIMSQTNFHLSLLSPSGAFKITERRGKCSLVFRKTGF